jgi:hypothetical protein
MWLAGPAMAADVATEPVLERSVKAAFLYKFLNYVEWPASTLGNPSAPFVIGVHGSDAMAKELQGMVADRPIAGRPVEVRIVRRGDAIEGMHVLFVAGAEVGQVASFAESIQRKSVLLVSESDRALDLGSSINLLVVNGRIRFDVSLEAAEKAGIRLSSRLLAIARNVRTGAQ